MDSSRIINGYTPLVFIVAALVGAGIMYLPLIIFIIGIMGVMVTVTGYMAVRKMASNTYPLIIRFWEERFKSFIVTGYSRAKEVRDDKGKLWYELINGKRIKRRDNDDERKIKGRGNSDYIDLVLMGNNDYIPLTYDLAKSKMDVEIVSEDMREFLADATIYANRISTKPKSNLDKLLPFVGYLTIGVAGIMMVLMITMFMNEFPKYNEYMKGQIATMDGQIKVMDGLLDKMCVKWGVNCGNQVLPEGGQYGQLQNVTGG